MEEIINIAPNGLEVTEEELLAEYGDQFQDLVANGTFKKKTKFPIFWNQNRKNLLRASCLT